MTVDEFKAWRAGRKLSQGAVGKVLGVSQTLVSQYESGAKPIPDEIARQIDAKSAPPAAPVVPIKVTDEELQKLFGERLRPYPKSNLLWGASASWDTRTPNAGWKRVPGCCRIVKANIPKPLPYYAPRWAGERGVPTADGRVFDAVAGHQMRDVRADPLAPRPSPAYGSRLKVTTKR